MGAYIYLFGVLSVKETLVSELCSDPGTVSCSYFRVLVQQFEAQLQQYRQQIEELENHLAAQANNSHITPQGNMLSVLICLIDSAIFFFAERLRFCYIVDILGNYYKLS